MMTCIGRWVLIVTLCQSCWSSYPVPDKVIGIFQDHSSIPGGLSLAVSEAVKAFNASHGDSWPLSYKDYTPDEIFSMNLSMSDDEPSLHFNNSIIISNYEVLLSETYADFLTTFLKTTHHFMIYTGVLNKYMRRVIKFHANLFYTRPDPDAVTHALYKITKSILDTSINSSNVTFVLSDSPSPYINSFIDIEYSLREYLTQGDYLYAEDIVSANVREELNVSLVLAEGVDYIDLLCHYIQNCYRGKNRHLIFIGEARTKPFNVQLERYAMQAKQNQNEIDVCSRSALMAVGEGHLFLEYPEPSSGTHEYEMQNVSLMRSELIEILRKESHLLYNYDEALLAFDSIWIVLNAINTALIKGNGKVSGESVGQELKAGSYAGVTGNFSFVRTGNGGVMRSIQDARINIFRMENGSYIQIGRHFNSNSNFIWHHPLLYNGTQTWRPTISSCNNSSLWTLSVDVLFVGLLVPLLVFEFIT